MTDINYKQLSKDFCKVWDKSDFDKARKKFMEEIQNIDLWALRREPTEGLLVEDTYNLPMYYKAVAEAINAFNEIYHVVDVTSGWKDKKDEEFSSPQERINK